MPSFKPVAAIERGLEVLRVVNDERHATVGAIHRATGLDKATIVRVLETLEHAGFVTRDIAPAGWMPTGRCLLLSRGYDRHVAVGRLAEPALRELRETIGWPCELAIFDGDAMVIADTGRPQSASFYVRQPGFRVPLLGSSLGIAYLAVLDPEEREAVIDRLASRPSRWNNLARDPAALDRLLRTTRERGYALSDPGYVKEVFNGKIWAIGVPIRQGCEVFATINVMLLRDAISQEQGLATCVAPMQRSAEQIAAALAGPSVSARAAE